MKRSTKESLTTSHDGIDAIKKAMERMHDALGVNYTSFHEVMEHLDDLRVDLKPTPETLKMVKSFKQAHEDTGRELNPVEFWSNKARQCESVLDAVRLYLEANSQQFSGVSVIKNRILFLANKGQWK